jgi:hypothetical protein
MDEGALLLYPHLLDRGWWPVRNYQTLYGVGNQVVLRLAYLVSPLADVDTERVVGIGYRLAILVAVIIVAARVAMGAAVVVGLVAAALLYQTTPFALAWYASVALLVWGLVLLTSRPRLAMIGAGLMTLALSFRPDIGLVVAGVLVVVLTDPLARWRAAVGAAVGALPALLHLAVIGPVVAVRSYVVDGITQSASRRLPLLTGSSLHDSLMVALWLAAVVVVANAVVRRTRPDLIVAVVVVGLVPQALQRAAVEHIAGAAAVAVPLAIVSQAHHWRGWTWSRVLAVSSAAMLVLLALPAFRELAGTAFRGIVGGASVAADEVRIGDRKVYLSEGEGADVKAALSAAIGVAGPSAKVFVGPADLTRTPYNDTYLYYLLDLEPSTYFLELNPPLPQRGSFADDVAAADVVVLDRELNRGPEADVGEVGPDRPNRIVASRFCEVMSGRFLVAKRC